MVSIVIISHSRKLAEGVRELAEQMTRGQVKIAIAGGVDDPENPIGTDFHAVWSAIQDVYSENGVLVLMDLGSAILSAESALEMFTPKQREHIQLCAAPLVEGTLAAAVQASSGADLASVRAEAEQALQAKWGQLAASSEPLTVAIPEAITGGRTVQFTVRNPHGLHARPAAQLVMTANRFKADIRLIKGERQANAKSINQVATLGARQGDVVTLVVAGAQAEEAIAAIMGLAAQGFGEGAAATIEPTTTSSRQPAVTPGTAAGLPASPGIAIAPAYVYQPTLPQITRQTTPDSQREWQQLHQAIEAAASELATQEMITTRQVGAAEAAIFGAQRLMLLDPDLQQQVRGRILKEQVNAAYAWQVETDALAEQYRQMDDPYWQARAVDVEDGRGRVLRHLLGTAPAALNINQPSILVADDLTPSDTARLDPAQVIGIMTQQGGVTAHSAILARALGIPAVVGCGRTLLDEIVTGQMIALDGNAGQVWLTPTPAEMAQLRQQQAKWQKQQQAARKSGQKQAVTRDGQRREVAANIGGTHDVQMALEYGAEGVGLFRTEYLFLDRPTAPSEEEQLAAYQDVGQRMAPRSVIIRTLDIGGDKPLAYLAQESEANPFLGWRGIRFCLGNPALFKSQLRAILRAAATCPNLKIMFPMVSVPSEVAAAKKLLAQCQNELRRAGLPYAPTIETGIMIEVPSAVAVADQLARQVDFFSIGTNDLTQYVMAADRGNKNVAELAIALQPAVLRMVEQTIAAAHQAKIPVAMCGELAGNPLAIPLLLGMGLDEFSMSAPAIPAVKAVLKLWTQEEGAEVAAAVRKLDSVAAAQHYLQQIKR
ncbi:MAG: phosphoenolpyruvate--protein phosphotransferase [Anaerolineae bacterium]|nr:phosphoenolpyruvate--protein phosphotransferase [Anaerolineae bacterium]